MSLPIKLSDASALTKAILVIALIGTLEAGYLTYVHYHLGLLACIGGHHGVSSCEQVQSSQYSRLAGIPVAWLGLFGYLGILGSVLFLKGELGRGVGFCIALIGCGYSLYLTYREVFTLKEICEWCVGSAILMTILAVLTPTRFLRGEPAPA